MRNLAAIMIVVATAATVDAKPKAKDVKVHMDKAAKAHKAGKFDVALTELQAAYEIDPQPKLLFAIAQVYAKLDNCEAAIEHYEKFNAATKDKSKQSVVKQAIDACKQKLAETPDKPDKADKGDSVFRAKKPTSDELPEAKPEPEQKVETAPPPPIEAKPPEPEKPAREIKAFDDPPPPKRVEPVAVTTTTTTTKTKPWYRDPLGDALVITGVGATIGSFFTYRSAQKELDAAEDNSSSLAQYDDHRNQAERMQLYTIVLAGGGIALITAGVLRYALRSNRTETTGVAIVPSGDGGLITWTGGF